MYHPKTTEKFSGTSLNDSLLTGPDLINSLIGILLRFSKEAVAIICNIERMFHQFHVTSEHRCYLRFLRWEKGDLESEPKEYQMKVHQPPGVPQLLICVQDCVLICQNFSGSAEIQWLNSTGSADVKLESSFGLTAGIGSGVEFSLVSC